VKGVRIWVWRFKEPRVALGFWENRVIAWFVCGEMEIEDVMEEEEDVK